MPDVNISYESLESMIYRLRAAQEQLAAEVGLVKEMIDQLTAEGFVTDRTSSQFQSSYAQINIGAASFIEGIDGVARYLEAAAHAFHETDSQLRQSLDDQ